MRFEIDGFVLECVEGEITDQRGFEAVVNAANAQLQPGGGVAGAIHRAAGPQLASACRPLAPIRPGQAVLTEAFDLPNDHVIHCLGPVYGHDEPAAELLASCYRTALRLAEERGIASIAFPALSTGAFGYPMREAAIIAMQTVASAIPHRRRVERVRFVLWGADALQAHIEAVAEVFGPDLAPSSR
ncbi:MAG TPA: macro domain-containing protein [Thermoanaerobaculia bacterium]|nr:macro domain-containing protein [Thermoanaerobaculia bacterium]